MFEKPYYCYHPDDLKSAGLARALNKAWRGVTAEECDVVIDVGGDGTIYYAMGQVPEKPNFAIKAESSRSKLYHGHENLTHGADLRAAVNEAVLFEFHPLKAEIGLSNGETVVLCAHSDIILERFAAQALITNLRSTFSHCSQRLVADSLIFATPMGSTGGNFASGGKTASLTSECFVVTGGNVCDLVSDTEEIPYLAYEGKCVSALFPIGREFIAELISPSLKRPVKVCHDSGTILPDGRPYKGFPLTILDDRFIESIRVGPDRTKTNRLLQNERFRTPAHLNI